jgi:prolyl-tRNA editing enzyme YbaK/EbsC (Cys-tRNA(Pro) deacylase)
MDTVPSPSPASPSATPSLPESSDLLSAPNSLDRVVADLAARAPELRVEVATTSTATVALAAEAFGVTPGRIAKSLALRVGDQALLIVASGDRRLDNRKIRQTFGGKGRMLDAEQTFAVTGHRVGGVCPFALTTDLPVYCDRSLQAYDEVLPAAGSLTSMVRITPQRLADLTGGRWVDVCQDPDDAANAG